MILKKDSPELDLINRMIKRDLNILKNKLYPEQKGEKGVQEEKGVREDQVDKRYHIKEAIHGTERYLLLVEHAARHDVYDELGGDVSEYGKYVKDEMRKIKIRLGDNTTILGKINV